MQAQAEKPQEVEQQRQQQADDLLADLGTSWKEENRPGTFGCHELLDRVALMARIVEENVLNHPACVRDPRWYGLANQAVVALSDLYQLVGAEHLTAESPR